MFAKQQPGCLLCLWNSIFERDILSHTSSLVMSRLVFIHCCMFLVLLIFICSLHYGKFSLLTCQYKCFIIGHLNAKYLEGSLELIPFIFFFDQPLFLCLLWVQNSSLCFRSFFVLLSENMSCSLKLVTFDSRFNAHLIGTFNDFIVGDCPPIWCQGLTATLIDGIFQRSWYNDHTEFRFHVHRAMS